MSSVLTAAPPAFLLFGLAVLVALLPRRGGHVLGVLGSLVTCGWVLSLPSGTHLETVLFGFDTVLLHVDVYSRLLGLIFAFIAAAGVSYAYTSGARSRQTAYAVAYLGAGMGAAFAGDWLTLVVFWELLALGGTLLLWYRAPDRGPGIRYAIYHEIGGLILIAGVVLHFTSVGTFIYGGGVTPGLPATLVAIGIGLNAGFVGLHIWLVESYPRTHVATSVVLAAVTTKVGAYTIVRAFPDGNLAIAYVGGAMVLFGVTFAILQSDVRRLLSYHIVSQVGYMVAGFGAGTALASAGALGHLVNHILYKSLLFMVAGVLIQRTGVESLKKMGGLAGTLPRTAGLFLVAALAIGGLPGFNGFVTKAMVIDGVDKAGIDLLWWMLLIGGIGTVISFAKFGYYAFLHGETTERAKAAADGKGASTRDLGLLELVTLGSLAVLCILFGLVPGLLFDLLPANGVTSAAPFAQKQFVKAGGVAVVGLLTFLVVKPRLHRLSPVGDLDRLYHPVGRRLLGALVRIAATFETSVNDAGARMQSACLGIVAGDSARSFDRVRTNSASIGAGILALSLALALLVSVVLL